MSEVAGLLILSSNYELKDVIDNDNEIKVITKATIQAAEIRKLQELGWELESNNVIVFKHEDLTKDFSQSIEDRGGFREVSKTEGEPRGMGPSPIVDFPPEVEPQPGSE